MCGAGNLSLTSEARNRRQGIFDDDQVLLRKKALNTV